MKNEPRRKAILRFIERFKDRFGFAPTVREIAEAAEVAVNTICYYIKVFEKLGFISRHKKKFRTLSVTEEGRAYAA